MRFRANGFAVALAALVLTVGCNKPAEETATTTTPGPDATATAPGSPRVHNDGLITSTIQAKYFGSADVKGRQIDVDTNEGVVTLKGRVDTEAQKQAAEQIARGTDGVSRVDNQLAVGTTGTADTTPARDYSANAGKSPAWITTKIQSQYFLNPELKPWRIDVDTTYGGVVTLSGRIDSEGDRAEAVRIAKGTEGVVRVNDNLRIDPVDTTAAIRNEAKEAGREVREEAREAKDKAANAADRAGDKAAEVGRDARDMANKTGNVIEDSWITMKIQSKYFADDDVRARNIDVDTKGGMVTLKGSVGSERERQQAIAIAHNTDGVTMVHDNLTLDKSSMRRDTSPSGTAGTAGQKIEDGWITMKVQSKYFMHDDIKAHKIDVDTKNGVVTLNGSVPSASAKGAAEALAKDTDGVTRVVNNLKVGA
jgi:hyperosmotically inducible periplasmic protein